MRPGQIGATQVATKGPAPLTAHQETLSSILEGCLDRAHSIRTRLLGELPAPPSQATEPIGAVAVAVLHKEAAEALLVVLAEIDASL